jgi:hypothetical protein
VLLKGVTNAQQYDFQATTQYATLISGLRVWAGAMLSALCTVQLSAGLKVASLRRDCLLCESRQVAHVIAETGQRNAGSVGSCFLWVEFSLLTCP